MNKKLFSFIDASKSKVELAPGVKVVPAEDLLTLYSSVEILEKVKEDAEKYKKQVVAETEELKARAEKVGFDLGFETWAHQLAKLEEYIAKLHQEMEKLIIPIAIKAAKKVVSKELELSKEAIVEIVVSTLKAVSQHKLVSIYVNRKDLDKIEAARPRLKQLFEKVESLTIRERPDIQPGGCVIETEVGIINAQSSEKWKILEAAFEKLSPPPLKSLVTEEIKQ